jgi:L-histidine N-alpha-methyltransferase
MFDAALVDDDITGDALAGLLATPKTLPPKLFYDAEGVRLFDAITQLPEYYLTRTERALLARIAPEIVSLAEAGSALVDYGACDESKALVLLDQPARRFDAYVPVDVARGALEDMSARLAVSHPWLSVSPVCGDFLRKLSLPGGVSGMPKFGFFPGSTIGNLDPAMAVAFLRIVRAALGPDGWLIVGADLRKSPDVLVPAYDDAQGVTAAFNLNVLRRLNREAAANFDLRLFRHRVIWNDLESRIEMHLESLADQDVSVAGSVVRFCKGETIHTENSYKHALPAFAAMAQSAGWETARSWTDPDGLFAVHALRGMGRV